MVVFLLDGASVNKGEINGVIALLYKHGNAYVIMAKSMFRRVELTFESAMKTSPLFNKVHGFLDPTFRFYHKSPKRTSGLKQAFEALNVRSFQSIRVLVELPGGRLNKKDGLTRYGDSHVKDKTS